MKPEACFGVLSGRCLKQISEDGYDITIGGCLSLLPQIHASFDYGVKYDQNNR